MRTSLDLPDELLRAAKIAAVKRGVTLRELFSEALRQELGRSETPEPPPRHVKFPIIPPFGQGTLRITPEMIRDTELDDDLRRSGIRS